ncbi:MAG TPA: serine protease, partial [Acidobacteriota bacterium]|nr:serine protease [Acidobacteriota bacterium]
MKQKLYRMLAILLVVMVCGGGALQAQNPGEDPGKARKLSVGPDGQSEEAVIRKAVLATVRIITGNRNPTTNEFYGTSSGSGVFIGSTGLILTARHVVFQQEGKGEVFPEIWCGVMSADSPYTPPNRGFRLQLVKDERQLDLALLRIPAPVNGTFPQLNLGTGSELFYGSLLRVAGFPEAGGATTTVVPTTVLGIDDQLGEIKVDGALMRGASGGPAFNAKGELIGIVLGVKKDTVPFFADE